MDFDENEMRQIEEELQKKKRPPRIAKSTGKYDRRTLTSKANARKANQVKLEKKYNIEEISDDSDSDDDVLILKKGSKKTKPINIPEVQKAPVDDYAIIKKELEEMKKLIAEQKVIEQAKSKNNLSLLNGVTAEMIKKIIST